MTLLRLRPAVARGSVRAPPSKSYTHRFLLAAHLADGPGHVRNALLSDDTLRTAAALRALGSRVRRDGSGWSVRPSAEPRSARPATVRCGQSGTTLRLLSGAAALQRRRCTFVGLGRLPSRPIAPLLGALEQLGAEVKRGRPERALPFWVRGPIHGGTVELAVDVSSQFTSSLLFALPTVTPDSSLRTLGTPVSEPYVRASLAVLRQRGVHVTSRSWGYQIPGGQRLKHADAEVPGDASSAAYLWAAAAVTGGEVTVRGVPTDWPQADLAVLPLLRAYGADVRRTGDAVRVAAGVRRPFSCELSDAPDLYPLAGVLAASAPGRSVLAGAHHVVHKESDRKAGTVRLAKAMGARVRETASALVVEGVRAPRALRLTALDDHRLVMSAAVAALTANGRSTLGDAEAVGKSFPEFFTVLGRLGAEVGGR